MSFPTVALLLEEGIAKNWHRGAQVALSYAGKVFHLEKGTGQESDPITERHLLLWLSSTKPIIAVAIAMLVERNAVKLEDPVAKLIPEFAQNGKAHITLRHILTHTGGFRGADLGKIPTDWEECVARVCAAPLEPRWVVGEKAGYHSVGSWVALGEIIRRADGRMVSDFVTEEIFTPLEMKDCWLGIPEHEQHRLGNRISPIYDFDNGETKDRERWNLPEMIALPHPAANGRGPASQLLHFYLTLLHGGVWEGRRILKESTVREWTSPQRRGMFDHTFRSEVDWGYGFRVNTALCGKETPYGFGVAASERAFGHAGAQSSVSFADPAYDLAAVILTNGRPSEPIHQRRMWDLTKALYGDLGIEKKLE